MRGVRVAVMCVAVVALGLAIGLSLRPGLADEAAPAQGGPGEVPRIVPGTAKVIVRARLADGSSRSERNVDSSGGWSS